MNPPRKASSSRGSQDKEAAPLSIDYDHLSRLCLKHWKVLAGGVVLGLLGGYFYAESQTPIYSAQATIEVNPKNSSSSNSSISQQDGVSDDMIKTYEQLLKTNLPERVVKSQHLNENAEFLPEGITPPAS